MLAIFKNWFQSMRFFSFLFFGFFLSVSIFSQKVDSAFIGLSSDTAWSEVTVTAFHGNQKWKLVPAAVSVIGTKELNRYAITSLVPVFNLIPGVRMEERSPASYRLSLRGSLLRSPFGVRNIKVYWNNIPLTDAGGNTYLNLLDLNQITGAEIIKGPAASSYGAGTGGALLMQSALVFSALPINRFSFGISGGYWGLFQQNASWVHTKKNFASSLQQNHNQADGYREQSGFRKDMLKWQGSWQLKSQQFKFLFFYTDLFYQTPGGITLAQMQNNPKLARQPAGALPGAAQQQTAVFNKTVFGGIEQALKLNNQFNLKNFISSNHTSFTNPFITNYEYRDETNFGLGTQIIYETQVKNTHLKWITGAEWLFNHSLISDFGNKSGQPDTVQFKDDMYANQWYTFSQADLIIHDQLTITVGISLNNQTYRYKRLTDLNSGYVTKKSNLVLTPRLAVLYRIQSNISLYLLAAKGFSTPSLAEIRPSDGNFYGTLEAEYGWNYEIGVKGDLFTKKVVFDVAAYFFNLQNAIVRRSNAVGAEYFVNAGGTKQNGIEAMLTYNILKKSAQFISKLDVFSSYSFQPYRFTEYQQTTFNYSGNEVTGVPKNIWVTGMDIETRKGVYCNISLNATSSLPLTDANDVYADAYRLVQVKLGYRMMKSHKLFHLFAGIDNLFNQSYTLGNDINAAGKRYYNPASGRNLFVGMQWLF